MHEFGIADALLQATLDVAKANGNKRVEEVKLRLGRLRQIVPDALEFAFLALSKETLADGSRLTMTHVPPRVRCGKCRAEYAPRDDWFWQCPSCGQSGGEALEGEELLLESVVLMDSESA